MLLLTATIVSLSRRFTLVNKNIVAENSWIKWKGDVLFG